VKTVSLGSASVLRSKTHQLQKVDQALRPYHGLATQAKTGVRPSSLISQNPDANLCLNVSGCSRVLNLSRSVHSLQMQTLSATSLLGSLRNGNVTFNRGMASLNSVHKNGPHFKKRPPRKPLDGNPFMKGVILRTLIKKPKKPNSANRKCVLVKLSNGKEKVAYVPGVGHNLQEHNVVLVRVGRLRDVPGVKIKCVRGVYDLPHVQKVKK